jgi:hypothetical protein
MVTDQDVVESYRQSCHPHGELGQYLAKGHLIICLGEVLFLHGALPITRELLQDVVEGRTTTDKTSVWQDLSFAMPWQRHLKRSDHETARNVPIIGDWVMQLNQFARDCVTHWNEYVKRHENSTTIRVEDEPIWSTHGGYNTTNPEAFTNLIQYAQAGLPDGTSNPTIVYSSFCPHGGMPTRLFPNSTDPLDIAYRQLVKDFFQQSGVRLIICGHQPQGDTLLPIRIESNVEQRDSQDNSGRIEKRPSNWILCCDTSYSGDTLWRDSSSDQDRINLGTGRSPSFRGDHAVWCVEH